MPLHPGYYFIFSGPRQVGRHPIEDRSLRPKRVLALPPGVRPLGPWLVQPAGPERYKLRALGAPTAEDNGLLWAYLMDEDQDFDWAINSKGDDYYTVEKRGTVGWVATSGEEGPWGTQIAVRHFNPDGEGHLFKFIRADRSEIAE
ncbi:hypothetical protein APHAL10511_006914 [Amanita phalloides]|nr:hypothetical protein APHAL10511_006914 [Amanita phalloides]